MDLEELLLEFDKIKLHKQKRIGASLKKPLFLLLLISLMQRGKADENKFTFSSIEKELDLLIRSFGGRVSKSRPEQPFHHLNSSIIWDLNVPYGTEINNKKTLNISILRDPETFGYFKQEVYEVLRSSEHNRAKLSQYILEKFWPETVQADIKTVLSLPEVQVIKRARNPKFTSDVLANYRNRCAICGFTSVFNQIPFGIDAAHIQWHSYDGPDILGNGIALCKLHHWTFDRGAISLKPRTLEIIISSGFVAQDEKSIILMEDIEGQRLISSRNEEPSREFIEWHNENVFIS